MGLGLKQEAGGHRNRNWNPGPGEGGNPYVVQRPDGLSSLGCVYQAGLWVIETPSHPFRVNPTHFPAHSPRVLAGRARWRCPCRPHLCSRHLHTGLPGGQAQRGAGPALGGAAMSPSSMLPFSQKGRCWERPLRLRVTAGERDSSLQVS